MKLYTEKQVIEAIIRAKVCNRYTEEIVKPILSGLTPIELPSNEKIDNFAQIASSIRTEKTQGEWIAYKSVIAGAKWVIEQIKQQDGRE
jgi:hypothetical protein